MAYKNVIDSLGFDLELFEPGLGALSAVDQKRHLHHSKDLRSLMSMMCRYRGIRAEDL